MKPLRTRSRALLRPAAGLAILLAGCAQVGFENRELVERERQAARAPEGSVYAGWRVFQARCAACHGADARGGAGPDLLPRVEQMGPRRFVDLVLRRYDWALPAQPSEGAREALLDELVQRRAGALRMPAWGGEPEVSAHIADLHAYLVARAAGTQGPDRPARP